MAVRAASAPPPRPPIPSATTNVSARRPHASSLIRRLIPAVVAVPHSVTVERRGGERGGQIGDHVVVVGGGGVVVVQLEVMGRRVVVARRRRGRSVVVRRLVPAVARSLRGLGRSLSAPLVVVVGGARWWSSSAGARRGRGRRHRRRWRRRRRRLDGRRRPAAVLAAGSSPPSPSPPPNSITAPTASRPSTTPTPTITSGRRERGRRPARGHPDAATPADDWGAATVRSGRGGRALSGGRRGRVEGVARPAVGVAPVGAAATVEWRHGGRRIRAVARRRSRDHVVVAGTVTSSSSDVSHGGRVAVPRRRGR